MMTSVQIRPSAGRWRRRQGMVGAGTTTVAPPVVTTGAMRARDGHRRPDLARADAHAAAAIGLKVKHLPLWSPASRSGAGPVAPAAARRGEVRRLARLAAEEAELVERESVLAYYSELFPAVVHAAEVPEAPLWGPPTPAAAAEAAAAAPAREEDVEARPQPPAGTKGVCAVCFRPTTFRCKQCKAVKYCCLGSLHATLAKLTYTTEPGACSSSHAVIIFWPPAILPRDAMASASRLLSTTTSATHDLFHS